VAPSLEIPLVYEAWIIPLSRDVDLANRNFDVRVVRGGEVAFTEVAPIRVMPFLLSLNVYIRMGTLI
jgi:hypothetical protein